MPAPTANAFLPTPFKMGSCMSTLGMPILPITGKSLRFACACNTSHIDSDCTSSKSKSASSNASLNSSISGEVVTSSSLKCCTSNAWMGLMKISVSPIANRAIIAIKFKVARSFFIKNTDLIEKGASQQRTLVFIYPFAVRLQ